MATRMSNKTLLDTCKRFIVADPGVVQSVDDLIIDAIITANREICHIDDVPLAWLRGSYDNLYTRYYGQISGITKAAPGVVTGESLDDDVTGHGFTDKDIIYMAGLGDDSMDELNQRLYRLNYVDATTFSLLNVDGQYAVDTSSLDTWSAGGYFYHAGIYLPTSTIHPTGGNTWDRWEIGDIYNVTFNNFPSHPISEEEALSERKWMLPGHPERWRYWRNDYQGFGSTEHYLMFHPFPSQRYNIRIFFEKSYPDPSIWTDKAYLPHPGEISDFIWHRALKVLIGQAEKMKRASTDGRSLMGRIEVLYGQVWSNKVEEDKVSIINLSRKMLGSRPSSRNFRA